MSYRHKKSAYRKSPEEILGNVLRLGLISYEFFGTPEIEEEIVSTEKSIPVDSPNVLPEDADDIYDDEEEEEVLVLPPLPKPELESSEQYVPIQELQFEVREVQEVIEKKKKRRNYLEFRVDYGKV
jgi:hypothetical protein